MEQFSAFGNIMIRCAAANKKAFINSVLSSLLHAVISFLLTYIIQIYVDSSLNTGFKDAALFTIAFGIVVVISQLCMTINNYLFDSFEFKIKETLIAMLHDKISKISAEDLENPQVLDRISKAQNGVEGYIYVYSLVHMLVFFYLPYFIGIELYLVRLSVKLAFIIIFIFIPEALAQFFKVHLFDSLEDDTVEESRMHKILEESIIDRKYYKESRINNAYVFLRDRLSKNMYTLAAKKMNAEKKSTFQGAILKLLTASGQMFAIYILIVSVTNDEISIGAFAAVFEAIILITAYLQEIISVHLGRIVKKAGLVKNFNNLMKSTFNQPDVNVIQGDEIVLKGVSYCYPCINKKVLDNINLTIRKGESIAIVGYNGAGKTTLSKIILGLLEPTTGTILFGNSFVHEGELMCSALFQKYEQYKLSIKDNIIIADHFRYKEDDVMDKISRCGIDISKLANREQTILSPEFGGIELSGGMWQRLSLARAKYKPGNFIILDEPTASIDPMEESKLYNDISDTAKARTLLLVTHRIGAARLCDRIIVLDKGKIVEDGTHEELLKQKKLYHRMFSEQAKWYV